MLIAQSGGPSMVINQSLVGAVLQARATPEIGRIYGAMHGIKGILDILMNSDLKENQRKYLSIMKISTQNLLSIINDVLDFSTIEMG